MPNGSHGGGQVSRGELLRVFESVHGDAVVGELVVPPSQDRKETVAADVRHLIRSADHELFVVEKVDGDVRGDLLVIHLHDMFDVTEEGLESGRMRFLYVMEDGSVFRDLEGLWRRTLPGQ